jgi:hypothetical protein
VGFRIGQVRVAIVAGHIGVNGFGENFFVEIVVALKAPGIRILSQGRKRDCKEKE